MAKISKDERTRYELLSRYRSGKLTKSQVAMVESIPDWTWDYKKTKAEQHLDTAKILAKNGILPSRSWLAKHGYKSLDWFMVDNPDLFLEYRQEKMSEPKREQYKTLAKKLAKDCVLPSTTWLLSNGYQRFYQHYKKRPELYTDYIQYSPYKSSEDHKNTAKQLVAKFGSIPSSTWLKTNGYQDFKRYRENHPEEFKEFARDRNRVSAQDHINTASKLAVNKILPGYSWLKENGYYGFSQFIKRHPELFVGYKYERGTKLVELKSKNEKKTK